MPASDSGLVLIEMQSEVLDSYIHVFSGQDRSLPVGSDDDSGVGRNARLRLRVQADSTYWIYVRSWSGDETGHFTLRVRREGCLPIQVEETKAGALTVLDPEICYALSPSTAAAVVIDMQSEDLDSSSTSSRDRTKCS